MREPLMTPSKITAWLDCAHYLTLRHEVERGEREAPSPHFGEMSRMLLDKGLRHEQAVLDRYLVEGREVFTPPARERCEPFSTWVSRVGDVLGQGHDVVYQMPFVNDGVRGVADFLERVDGAAGTYTYEPVDAKLARREAKPGHVLQLCFYAEAIGAGTGRLPERLHLELGSGARETVGVAEVLPYWRRLRGQLAALVARPPDTPTTPEPCDHCPFCEFQGVCESQWRGSDSLVHVAGVRHADRVLLADDGVTTIAGLAALDHAVPDMNALRTERLVRQARLQVRAREAGADTPPPYERLEGIEPGGIDPGEVDPGDVRPGEVGQGDADAGTMPILTGFAAQPLPDAGDVFLDFEGHPFWKADDELFFLFGYLERSDGAWTYTAIWAHDKDEERSATHRLVHHIRERRERFPGMHVYHYNHTERTALTRLADVHGVAELELEELIGTGAFVDLLPVVTGAVQIGVESYGLKQVERLTDFVRGHDIDRGSGAVVEYERWMHDGDGERLGRVARYNEDDVRATLAVRDWLVDHRPTDMPWRPAALEPPEDDPELDARIQRLHEYAPGSPEHLLGDLLGYWRRERRVVAADSQRLSMADPADQLDALGAIAGIEFQRYEDRFSEKTGKKLKWPAAAFTFPPQPIDPDITTGSTMILALDDQHWAFFTLCGIDRDSRTLTVEWNQKMIDQDVVPTSLVLFPSFREGAKLAALSDLADEVLDGRATRAGHAILRNDPPSFLPAHVPDGRIFGGGYQEICAWAPYLDRSYVPVQGPPGTGKTFTGAHVVRTLVADGQRVGITAMSHHAIDNLTQAVAERFRADGAVLRAVRKAKSGPVDGVDYVESNNRCGTGPYDVIAGTPWLFASQAMRENPVDVLLVDEAGQLGLADTLAASMAATNVILLGDPQQLPQVSQANHPGRSGVSALEHILGAGVHTVPPDRGVLLDVTWRMHPDVCGFISEVMYDGRLSAEDSCGVQTTAAGTGLRWLRAHHYGCSTESAEEAAMVAATVGKLLGTPWTDQTGRTRPLTADDVIVVTPYNDQRRLISAVLGADPATSGVRVGTVDKFQGREAAVVIFSMTTSSSDFMPRNADFLFSKNRLNVAVSRARCLAYLICTDELLDTRARDVEQMTLISALCSFVERAHRVGGPPTTAGEGSIDA